MFYASSAHFTATRSYQLSSKNLTAPAAAAAAPGRPAAPSHRTNHTSKQHSTLLCRDLSELASYAKVDNRQFRLLKLATPGAYTFILEASKEVPRRLSHPQRKTIGLRVPDHKVLQELLAIHGAPLLATTLIPAGETEPMNDAEEIRAQYENALAAVVDAGACPLQPTTVIDLTGMGDGGDPVVVREGRGSLSALGM